MRRHRERQIIVTERRDFLALRGLPGLIFAFALFGMLAYCGHHPESWTIWDQPQVIPGKR